MKFNRATIYCKVYDNFLPVSLLVLYLVVHFQFAYFLLQPSKFSIYFIYNIPFVLDYP